MKKMLLLSALAAVSLIAADKISGAGASFPAPIYYQWAHAYEAATGIQVNYQSIGSGGGIKQIQARTVDFGASDEPLEPAKLAADKLLQYSST
jgi:phosphate transport system substrate-binding protein